MTIQKVRFDSIEQGECFRHDGHLCIKGDFDPGIFEECNIICIDLNTGICYYYGPDIMVTPVNAVVEEQE